MTYSIVARDPGTGQLGVAVQSHWFSVGSLVTWARPGVGAVATQAFGRAAYGPRGLELMAAGASAGGALAAALEEDPKRDWRQVAMVSAVGDPSAAAFTGERCLRIAGDVQGDGVSCQANIMVSESVWPAMLEAFQGSALPLPARLLAALRAAQDAGGDLRGEQSAALLVVPAEGEWWETDVSLRVEDSSDPLGELERLLSLHEAYGAATEGDDRLAAGDAAGAAQAFARARSLAPDSDELAFWAALGAHDEAAMAALCARAPQWAELRARLPSDLRPG